MRIRNLIVGMQFLFILAGFSGLVEARRQQRNKFLPGEKEDSSPTPVCGLDAVFCAESETHRCQVRLNQRKSPAGAESGAGLRSS